MGNKPMIIKQQTERNNDETDRQITNSKGRKNNQKYSRSSLNFNQKKRIPIQTQGLPNIGNTCFLNSIIQLLVSSKSFRETILAQNQEKQQIQPEQRSYNQRRKQQKQNQNLEQKDILQYFRIIFQKIVYGSSLDQKRKTMKSIVNYLSKNSIEYQSYSQQDSLHFLMFLLNNLFKQNKQIEQLFRINFKFVCKNQGCHKNDQFQQYTLDSTQFICKKCKESNIIIFLNEPKIILFMRAVKNQIGRVRQSIYFKKKNENKNSNSFFNTDSFNYVEYRLKAKILYFGNGRSGHYIAVRRKINEDNQNKISNGAQFYEFNDASIHKVEQKQNENTFGSRFSSNFTQKVCLYEFFQFISQKQYQKKQKEENDFIKLVKEQRKRLQKQEKQRRQRQERQQQIRLEKQRKRRQEQQKQKIKRQEIQKQNLKREMQNKQDKQKQKLQNKKEQKRKEEQKIQRQENQNKKIQTQKNQQRLKILEEYKKTKEKEEQIQLKNDKFKNKSWNPLSCCFLSKHLSSQSQFSINQQIIYEYIISFQHYSKKFNQLKKQTRKVHFTVKKKSQGQSNIKYITPQKLAQYQKNPSSFRLQKTPRLTPQLEEQLIQQFKKTEKIQNEETQESNKLKKIIEQNGKIDCAKFPARK